MEEHGSETFLLVLDPLHNGQQMAAVIKDPANCVRLLTKSVNQIKKEEYEIVFIDGVLTDEERMVSSKILGDPTRGQKGNRQS